MTTVELKDHFFRLQTGEIPVDGDLLKVIVQLCHQHSIVDTSTGQVLGHSPGEGIIDLETPEELELEFPGFTERMDWIKIALVTKALMIIEQRKQSVNQVPPDPLIPDPLIEE